MAYTKQTFKDGETVLKAEHLNHIEDGISKLYGQLSSSGKVYCWGDSLTQGEGSNLKLNDGVFNSFNLHPYTNELTDFQVVNLGCQGEDVITIMARQGADPMVLGGFTIPADSTAVVVGNTTDGIPTASGGVARPLKPMEAGINPCSLAGVKGILHRGSSQNDSDDNYYFTRLTSGESVTVPSGTSLETFAMTNYRNGAAVIWMGANGGWSSAADFITKVNVMLGYGNYSDYLILLCREFSGDDITTITNAFTDLDGTCHVLNLYKELPIHGLSLANMTHYYFDTSSYANGDEILLKAPVLCECNSSNGTPTFGGLHFSAYGYKAIGKLVAAKLTELFAISDAESEPYYETNVTDSYGTILWRLTKPYTSNGTTALDTGWAPYDEEKNWTIAIKFSDSIQNLGEYGSIFESRDDDNGTSVCLRKNTISDETCCSIGLTPSAGFDFKTSGGFFEWVGGDFSDDGYHYLVLSKNGDKYVIAFDGGIWDGYGASHDGAVSDMTLTLFARRLNDGSLIQYTKGEITDFRIYDTNFSAAICTQIVNEMKSDS